MSTVRERYVLPGEYEQEETSIKVMSYERQGDRVLNDAKIDVRVRVKVVDDHVVVMIESAEDAPEIYLKTTSVVVVS